MTFNTGPRLSRTSVSQHPPETSRQHITRELRKRSSGLDLDRFQVGKHQTDLILEEAVVVA